jgi:hypothetical protein
MHLKPVSLAIAGALAIAVIWTICSILIVILPSAMLTMTAHMIHAELADLSWHMSGTGFLVGLIAWSVWTAITGWLIAVVYNRLAGTR